MKKYMITEQPRFLIVEGMHSDYQAVASEIYALKPIEPLSDDDINQMWYEATAGRMHIKLARAIERHLLGSETP